MLLTNWDFFEITYADIYLRNILNHLPLKGALNMDYLVFSETDASEQLRKITKNNLHIFKMFEVNRIPDLTIGPDGQRLNVVEF